MSVYRDGAWVPETNIPPTPDHEKLVAFLRNCLDKGIKTVEDVRESMAG